MQATEGSVTIGTGMGICIPATRITEKLNRPDLRAMRMDANRDEMKCRNQDLI
jgi:hypothetical protein